MAYETILVETKGKVGVITLNSPQALNALNGQLIGEINRALDGFEADASIGCVVLTGSEKAFAAGADIKEMQSRTFPGTYLDDKFADWDRIGRRRKPIVAAVSGFALGGGCELAMMCDFIIAADNAKFGQPEINLGVIPGAGGTQRLTRAVGKAKAMDLCLTGRMMGAEEAERSGLVARVVPLAELLPYKRRMGWKFDWVSSYASDFNFDMQVSFSDRQIASGDTTYNFETRPLQIRELPGASVFYRDDKGDIFLTFMVRARGGDALIGAYHYLDLTPKGRNEDGRGMMSWVRLHDQYEDRQEEPGSCCH